MSDTEWTDEEWQLDQAVMDAEEVRPSGQVARLRAIREEWPKLRATVAALTAENERLRGLLADSDPACTADCGYPALCFMYPNERHAGCPRQAAALPSSRETTDGQ